MKTLLKLLSYLIILMSFSFYPIYTDSLLSKFHQSDYKLRNTRGEIETFNKEYTSFAAFKTFKYNRTTTAHNLTVAFKFDLKDEAEVLVQAYKLYSNEYRHFPARFQLGLCKAIKANVVGVAEGLIKCGNLATCNILKGVKYQLCNFIIDETRLPPHLPTGEYKAHLILSHLNRELMDVNLYFEVYRPLPQA